MINTIKSLSYKKTVAKEEKWLIPTVVPNIRKWKFKNLKKKKKKKKPNSTDLIGIKICSKY